jgi:hypothetical protein
VGGGWGKGAQADGGGDDRLLMQLEGAGLLCSLPNGDCLLLLSQTQCCFRNTEFVTAAGNRHQQGTEHIATQSLCTCVDVGRRGWG